MLLAVICVTSAFLYFSKGLPQLNSLSSYQPPLVSRIFNDHGELIAEYADEHRILTPMSEIPPMVKDAFLAAEDEHFYSHPGINPARIMAAMLANLKAGHTVQGASTITQQVAKNFLLTNEKSYVRKAKEAILSWRIEQAFSKDDILYLYLNHIFLGRGSYGVTSAAWRYFHKRLDELTLGEAAMLAGLPKAPSTYAPHLNNERATQRRDTVLLQMQRSGFASAADVGKALKEPLIVAPLPARKLNNAYASLVHETLINTFGRATLRRQGLSIIVPYDEAIEDASVHALRKGVLNLERQQPYLPPKHHEKISWASLLENWKDNASENTNPLAADELMPALIESVKKDGSLLVNDGTHQWQLSAPDWTWDDKDIEYTPERPKHWVAGDEILLRGDGQGGVELTQKPSIESALYSVDLKRGTVLARVGGFDFDFGDFDRVSQAKRQPGSSFKPFLYTTALEKGFTPATIVVDAPIVFDSQSTDDFWRPENYGNRFAGPVTLRNALEHSRNLVAIRVLQDIGINTFLRRLRDYPFDQKFPKQLALALGVTEVTPEQMVESYIVIASGGLKYKPVAVQQVQDRNGQTLHRSVAGNRCQTCHADPVFAVNEVMRPAERILDPVDAFLIQNMMTGVVQRGTARKARVLKRPVAGKTGTTNQQIDAWFMGFTPQVLTGVWVGKDTPSPMGRKATGSGAALPIWIEAMQAMHNKRPIVDFHVPEQGIEWAAIDAKTGLLAGPSTRYPFLEAFREGTAPTEISPDTRVEQGNDNKEPTDFFNTEL